MYTLNKTIHTVGKLIYDAGILPLMEINNITCASCETM